MFLSNSWPDFSPRNLNLNTFFCVALIHSKVLLFFLAIESWWTRNVRKCCLSSIDSIFKVDLASPSRLTGSSKSIELVVLNCLLIPTRPSRKLQIWSLLSISELTVIYSFKFFFDKIACDSVDWNVDLLNMRKDPMSILILSIFKLIIPHSNRLEFLGQCFHWDFFVDIGLFVKMICCMFDQFFIRDILTKNIAVRLGLLYFVK